MNVETIYQFCLSLPYVTEDSPFGEDNVVFRIENKVFIILFLEKKPNIFNTKCLPKLGKYFREHYTQITEGYHMNKKHWISVSYETLPEDFVKNLIIHSYETIYGRLPKKTQASLDYSFQNPFENISLE